MPPRIQLTKAQKEEIARQLKEFFHKERDEEIGDLAALLLLDFMLEHIGPVFYNQGIQDCITLMRDKLEDLYGLEI